jgi:hypothetical protein
MVGGSSVKSPQSSEPDELQAFLLSRQQHAAANEIDWGERRREWIDAVEQLYRNITGELLAEDIEKGLVTVSRGAKEIKEEYLGRYRVPELILDISGQTVRFSPKGRNIIGAKGRVDLVGELDAMTLILEPAGHWSVVVSRVPRHVVSLDRRALAEALPRVMR